MCVEYKIVQTYGALKMSIDLKTQRKPPPARLKKTDDERPLTSKQARFVQLVGEGVTDSEAYKIAFERPDMSKAYASKKAEHLRAHHRVGAAIKEMQANLIVATAWSRESSVRALLSAYELSQQNNNPAGMIAAVKELNIMHGYNAPQKVEVTHSVAPQLFVCGPEGGPPMLVDGSQIDGESEWVIEGGADES